MQKEKVKEQTPTELIKCQVALSRVVLLCVPIQPLIVHVLKTYNTTYKILSIDKLVKQLSS